MIKTYGLTHVALRVKDPDRSLAFYEQLFGVKEYFRDETSVQVKGPGPYDIIVFEKAADAIPQGGIDHFGFRLTDPEHIGQAIKEAESIGAKIIDQGEFSPGLPYLYIEDPDGHMIEIWYE